MDEKIVNFIKNYKFSKTPPKEANIFDIGIHNMYENPFTEVLLFIIKSDSPYKNRVLFIKHFIFELTNNDIITNSFCKKLNIEIQVITKKGKYIDMLIYNDDYVLVFENKIDHVLNNPLKEYESEVNARFKSQKKLFYIFSKDECVTNNKWENKLISNVFSKINNNLTFDYRNKWDNIVKDFLNHYIKEKKKMTKKELTSIEKNLSKFMDARDYLEQFVEEIIVHINKKLKPKRINRSNWDNGIICLGLKPSENEYPKIDLCLDYGDFYLDIYYDEKSGKNETELKKIVGNKYIYWPQKRGIIKGFELGFKNLEDTYKELGIQWKKMKEIYKIKQ
jgi:hypothetical protein